METDLKFRISSRCSEGGGCVAVATTAEAAYVQDAKLDDIPTLQFSPDSWGAFVAGLKAGEFDLS